jgi:hypothetical protein
MQKYEVLISQMKTADRMLIMRDSAAPHLQQKLKCRSYVAL